MSRTWLRERQLSDRLLTQHAFVLHVFRKLIHSFREGGARSTVDLLRKNLAYWAKHYINWRFDRTFQVDTRGLIELSELTSDSVNKNRGLLYEPTPIRTLKRIFSFLPADVSDFTFIDFGSGKGRTILCASNYNFRSIIGVEFTKELHSVAKANIRTYRSGSQRCFNIKSICTDAVNFSLPPEKCVLYFFHPFDQEVMDQVLHNIEQSFRRDPRTLIVLYYDPQVSSLIQRRNIFHKQEERILPLDLSGEPPFRRRLEVYTT